MSEDTAMDHTASQQTPAPTGEITPGKVTAGKVTTAIRLGAGLIQGIALFLLHHAESVKAWPATQPLVFAPLVLVAAFAPFVILAGIGALRRNSLIVWALGATAFTAGLAFYGAWHGIDADKMPDVPVFVAIAAGLFIAHHLIQPAEAERRIVAAYPAYFDITWMHGVQLVLSVGFTGAFWILLFLGASLFKLIGIDAFQKLISEEAFAFPATTVMFAAAVQLTDVRSTLVRGVRTVALTLLAWLLPLMTLIAAGFLASLPFTGLEPLWKTRAATALLLTAAAHLIVLINAAYQDGDEAPPTVLKWAARIAGVLLIPIALLAAYGLALRVGQHGLTPDRVFAAAFVLVASGHAAGYALAAVRPGPWMKGLERTNVLMAFVILALLTALFTPIADPARLSVNDQVRRLERGTVKPAQFDYAFLRFDGGRHGRAVLERLKTSSDPQVAREAVQALAWNARPPINARPRFTRTTVYPAGRVLPQSLVQQDWLPSEGDSMCVYPDTTCSALLLDVDGDGHEEVLFSNGQMIDVIKQISKDSWKKVGTATTRCNGADLDKALKAGSARMADPVPRRDILIGDLRLAVTPFAASCALEAPSMIRGVMPNGH
jgi:hypothetical protein